MFTPFRIFVGLAAAYLAFQCLWNGYYVLALPPLLIALYVFEPLYLHLRAARQAASASPPPPSPPPHGQSKPWTPPPRESKVRSDYFEMIMDLRTGNTSGTVLKGRFANRPINSLTLDDLLDLVVEIPATDEPSNQLLYTYLETRHPNWRDAAARKQSAADDSRMTPKRARELLGLKDGASKDEIIKAWREALRRNHPDTGGTDAIAAMINQAKECLLPKQEA